MAKNLEDIRKMVRSFIDEPIPADWTDEELNTLINTYYHHVHSAVVDVFEEYADMKTTTTDIVAGQQEYETQLDLMKMRRVEIKYDPNSTLYRRALPVSFDEIKRSITDTNMAINTTTAPLYYLKGNIIGFLPVPTADVVDGIKSWYYAQKQDLANDSDEISLPYADRDWLLIAYGAASEALRFGQQEEGAANNLEAKYKTGIQEMQERLEDRIADNYKGTIDVSGSDLGLY